MSFKLPDTSLELILERHHEGVKLNKPNSFEHEESLYSLDNIFKLPCNVYFDNYDHVAVNMNELSVKTCGYESAKEIIGRSGLEFFTDETAKRGAKNQIEVMQSGKVKIIQDTLLRHDEMSYSYVSISFPWYSQDDKIIGVFGCSFAQSAMAESLTQLYELGLLSKPINNHKLHLRELKVIQQNFSIRQIECIELIMQGKSSKEMAKILFLSPRTIEHYIATIKDKVNVKTKSELMVKVNEWLSAQKK